MSPTAERRLKWNELAIRIQHYEYYLGIALHVTAFFYAITGGVLGFYLKEPAVAVKYQLELFLLLPILIGSVLGGMFIYGARLQEKAIDSMEHIRDELRERLGLTILFLLAGLILPALACGTDNRLKVRRTSRMLRKLESWGRMVKEERVDVSDLQGTDFYYELRHCHCLTKKQSRAFWKELKETS